MATFRSSTSQAKHAVQKKRAIGKSSHAKAGGDGKIHSLGTERTYLESLKKVAEFITQNRLDYAGRGLSGLTSEIAESYLEHRSQDVGQKQLDKDRQAMQMLLGVKLPIVKSELDQAQHSRAYTFQQIELIVSAQSQKHSLSTQIAANAGLRAHELLTLMPVNLMRKLSDRKWTDDRFLGRNDVERYTVKGKGGLVREVAISHELSKRLELLRLPVPQQFKDRDIYYSQFYDIGGGKQWSDSFTKAADRELGWTTGGHGVRHTYAQSRMMTLLSAGINYDSALAIVSQEMGHFRPDITEVYLR